MSELAEIYRLLREVRDSAVKTGNDVQWIKEGMEQGRNRMNDHDKDISNLKSRQNYWAGGGSVIGALFGIFGSYLAHGR